MLHMQPVACLFGHAVVGWEVRSLLDLPTAASARPSLALESSSVSINQLAPKPHLPLPRHIDMIVEAGLVWPVA